MLKRRVFVFCFVFVLGFLSCSNGSGFKMDVETQPEPEPIPEPITYSVAHYDNSYDSYIYSCDNFYEKINATSGIVGVKLKHFIREKDDPYAIGLEKNGFFYFYESNSNTSKKCKGKYVLTIDGKENIIEFFYEDGKYLKGKAYSSPHFAIFFPMEEETSYLCDENDCAIKTNKTDAQFDTNKAIFKRPNSTYCKGILGEWEYDVSYISYRYYDPFKIGPNGASPGYVTKKVPKKLFYIRFYHDGVFGILREENAVQKTKDGWGSEEIVSESDVIYGVYDISKVDDSPNSKFCLSLLTEDKIFKQYYVNISYKYLDLPTDLDFLFE